MTRVNGISFDIAKLDTQSSHAGYKLINEYVPLYISQQGMYNQKPLFYEKEVV